jgi:hypothetical protein
MSETPTNSAARAGRGFMIKRRSSSTTAQDESGFDDTYWPYESDFHSYDPAEFDIDRVRGELFGGPDTDLHGPLRVAPHDYDDFEVPQPPPSNDDTQPQLPAQRSVVDEMEPSSGLVRPYFRTKGRTRPDRELAVEVLVATSKTGHRATSLRVPEHRAICELCLDTKSVAEVAAHLGLPLGVVRVLISDLLGLGLVIAHPANASVGDRPSIDFMERVLSGLRAV